MCMCVCVCQIRDSMEVGGDVAFRVVVKGVTKVDLCL